MSKFRPFLIIVTVLAAAVIGGALLLRAARKGGSLPGMSAPSPPPLGARSLSADAVVTLEEFGDYQCPPCGQLHPFLKQLKQDYGSNLNFIFRNLPLASIHKNAMEAAKAAEAARIQDRFWEMHDLLYESQDLWKDDINPRSIFLKFAGDLGLDTNRFAKDMDDKQVLLRIQADQEAAAQRDVQGTPTIIIEGQQLLPETTNPDGVRKAIQLMISRKISPKR